MHLVSGRACGPCTACCHVPPIETAEVTKGPNTPCVHCVAGSGCRIYERRPQACRDSYCGWRAYPELDDDWRPDRCGVLILTDEGPGGTAPPGLKFVLLDGDEPLATARFVGVVSALASRGVPVALAVQGPPGHWPVKAYVNRQVVDALRARDAAGVAGALARVAKSLRAGPFEFADIGATD